VLGLLPGVGAIYNGQYAKGLLHVVVLGALISIVSSNGSAGLEPLFGMMIPLSIVYMAFEAYHTAKRRQMGLAVDEFSSLMPLRTHAGGFPVGPVLLIAIGALFLLNNLDLLRFYHVLRYWPVLLILLGFYLLYNRLSAAPTPVEKEISHEPR
jgi:hypothetical protein